MTRLCSEKLYYVQFNKFKRIVLIFTFCSILIFVAAGDIKILPPVAVPETFIPKALLGWNTKFEMVILDKSGKTLFKTSEKSDPWNGKINNNGQILPDGIYLWKVITYDSENNAHRHHGKITLVKQTKAK